MIGGNPEELRDLARDVRRWSAELADVASAVAAGRGVRWESTAADRYRDRLAAHARDVAAARDEVDQVAASLTALADTLQERQAAIRRAQDLVLGVLDDARRTVSRLWDVAEDVLTSGERAARSAAQELLRTVPALPAPGEAAWEDLARRVGGR